MVKEKKGRRDPSIRALQARLNSPEERYPSIQLDTSCLTVETLFTSLFMGLTCHRNSPNSLGMLSLCRSLAAGLSLPACSAPCSELQPHAVLRGM